MKTIPRRSGKTAAAMLAAPPNSYYVWCNRHLDYPIGLAKELGRLDLVIVAPSWLNRRNIMTHERIEVTLDHATMLDTDGYIVLQMIEQRKRI